MQSSKHTLGFNDVAVRIIGIPIIAFITPFIFYDLGLHDGMAKILASFSVSSIYTLIYWHEVRFLLIFSRKKYPGILQERKRIIIQSVLILVVAATTSTLLSPIACFIKNGPDNFKPIYLIADYAAALMNSALVVSVYEAAYFFQRYRHSSLEAEQLRREIVQSQLETLKSQVNPHFLFNSLNTLVSIIPDNPDVAVDFVRNMSKVYRYILEIKDKELITLEEELEFLKSYIFLQKIRFGENLQIDLNIPSQLLKTEVVPLSLQLLLENAIKHNIVSAEKPLYLQLETIKDAHLSVRNNLQLRQQVQDSTGTGLKNISNRYAFATGRQIEKIVTATHFIVILPLIKAGTHAHIDS
ncbi:MAG: histidine kinase [Chitinophagales bacterium]|nr:histidine kinase [Chitinophagales bacterium]